MKSKYNYRLAWGYFKYGLLCGGVGFVIASAVLRMSNYYNDIFLFIFTGLFGEIIYFRFIDHPIIQKTFYKKNHHRK